MFESISMDSVLDKAEPAKAPFVYSHANHVSPEVPQQPSKHHQLQCTQFKLKQIKFYLMAVECFYKTAPINADPNDAPANFIITRSQILNEKKCDELVKQWRQWEECVSRGNDQLCETAGFKEFTREVVTLFLASKKIFDELAPVAAAKKESFHKQMLHAEMTSMDDDDWEFVGVTEKDLEDMIDGDEGVKGS